MKTAIAHKWSIESCRRTGLISLAPSNTAAPYEYRGIFVSDDRPDNSYEKVIVYFFAKKRKGTARMRVALDMGPLSTRKLISKMEEKP